MWNSMEETLSTTQRYDVIVRSFHIASLLLFLFHKNTPEQKERKKRKRNNHSFYIHYSIIFIMFDGSHRSRRTIDLGGSRNRRRGSVKRNAQTNLYNCNHTTVGGWHSRSQGPSIAIDTATERRTSHCTRTAACEQDDSTNVSWISPLGNVWQCCWDTSRNARRETCRCDSLLPCNHF